MTITKNLRVSTRRVSVLPAALIAAALLGGATIAQAADQPAKTVDKVEQVTSDSWITTKVKSEILANSVSKAFKVEVETKNGVVALKGKLANKDAVDLVIKIAEGVKGVKSVDAAGLAVG